MRKCTTGYTQSLYQCFAFMNTIVYIVIILMYTVTPTFTFLFGCLQHIYVLILDEIGLNSNIYTYCC